LTGAAPVLAQQSGPSASHLDVPFAYDGPPPPDLPATMTRDEEGRTTMRAIRLTSPLKVDGLLDEALYSSTEPVSAFVMAEPQPGGMPTEQTDVWVSFDADNVYVSLRAWESDPARLIANEMRRDSNQMLQNDHLGVAFDTFYDRRNSFNFYFSPIGGRMDGQNNNEGNYNGDWNPVWSVAVRRDARGWTGEAAIPFKSLRYRPGRSQIWGVQFRRVNRWKNEMSHLTRVPENNNALNGIMRASSFATLVGIEAPEGTRPLDLKPYVTSNLTTDATANPQVRNDLGGDVGFDVKYGLTQNLTADFTYNTDFAQVEVDEQQVNLTRFSLFFPEKREFFLENQGLFNFGGVNVNNQNNNTNDAPILFYSRRIGLEQGHPIPIEAGGRVTGRVGRFSLGVLDIQTDDDQRFGVPATNFSVARVKQDVLRRSAIGALFTRRSVTSNGPGASDTFGLDGTFAFYENVYFQTYWAKTDNPRSPAQARRRQDDTSYRNQFFYSSDRYLIALSHLYVWDQFNPQVGFARRTDINRSWMQARFSPRPQKRFTSVRKFTYQVSTTYIQDTRGHLETREHYGQFTIDFQNSDAIEINYVDGYEFLRRPFAIARDATIPGGGYDLRTLRAQLTLGQQRPVAGEVFVEGGPFYTGDRLSIGYGAARVRLSSKFALEPRIQIDRVSLPFGDFTNKLASSRVTYTLTPMMFVSGLVQYNSSNATFSTNVRFRWEYLPGSELFVVYNEGRDTGSLSKLGIEIFR
jgi:hypothetical protein